MTTVKNVLAVDREQAIRNLLRSTMLRACVSCAAAGVARTAPAPFEAARATALLPELRRLFGERARVAGNRPETRAAVRTSSLFAREASV